MRDPGGSDGSREPHPSHLPSRCLPRHHPVGRMKGGSWGSPGEGTGVSPHPLCRPHHLSSPVCSVLPLPRAGHTGMPGKLNVIALTPCQESCLTVDGIFHLDAGQVPRAPRPSAPPSPARGTRGTPAAHREVLSTSGMLGPWVFSYAWLCWCFSPLPCFLLGVGMWLPCCDTLRVPCPPCCAI